MLKYSNDTKMSTFKLKKIITWTVFLIIFLCFTVFIIFYHKITFFFYMNKELSEEKEIVDKKIKQYYQKKENHPYKIYGRLTGNFLLEINGEKYLSYPTKGPFGITFNGYLDKLNKIKDNEINLNYGENINWPLKYRQTGGFSGIQTDYLQKQYLMAKNEDFENILKSVIHTQSYSKLDSFSKPTDILEKMSKKKELTYEIKNIIKSLSKEKFIKLDNGKYKIILNTQDVINIVNALGIETKIDIDILGQSKLNVEITVSKVHELNIKVDVCTSKNSKPITVSLLIDMLRHMYDDNLEYNFSIKAIMNAESRQIFNYVANLDVNYTGLTNMDKVNENYLLKYDLIVGSGELKGQAEFKNTINFVDNIKIPDFTNEETINLSQYSDENLKQFKSEIKEKIEQINKQLLDKTDIERKLKSLSLIGLKLFENGTINE